MNESPGPELVRIEGVDVELRRSARRRKTVSARREEGVVVVHLPARMGEREAREWATTMVRRVLAAEARRRPPEDPDALRRRANALARAHLDAAARRPVRPSEVRWVTNQGHRWGSCSPDTGVIRLSSRLQSMPTWVSDYVLVHELAHLVEYHHTPRFHQLVARYPDAERARGFLEGWQAATASGQAEAEASDEEAPREVEID